MDSSGEYPDGRSLDLAADALAARPGAIALALTGGGVRLPLPDDPRFGHVVALPGDRETVIDFVVPADRMAVVGIWERARLGGLAQGRVRLSSAPDRPMILTILDATHRYGSWLGFLVPRDEGRPVDEVPALDPAPLVPTRPRTATLHKNIYAVITHVDARVEPMLGWPAPDMLGRRSLDFIHPDDHERAIGQWLEMRIRRGTTRVRVRHLLRDGSWLWVELENTYVGADDPEGTVAVCELSDISDEMAAHEEVRRRERLFHRLAESMPDGLFLVGVDQDIVFANTRLGDMLGVSGASTLPDQLVSLSPASRDVLLGVLTTTMNGGTGRRVEVEVVHPPTGELRWCLANVTALSDDEGLPGAIVTLSDITESSLLRERLRYQASHDSLTGCLNRASTLDRLQHLLERPQQSPVAVLFIDLDNFKAVNDTLGHVTGDRLLAEIGNLMTDLAGSGDVAGRLGGDEFLMICTNASSPAEALAVAGGLQRELARTVAAGPIRVSASIGVAMATAGVTVQALMNRADQAMYRSKRERGHLPVYLS